MRRFLGTAVVVLALTAGAATADAQDTGGDQWAGSAVSATSTGDPIAVQAFFDRSPDRTVQIRITLTGGPDLAGCTLPGDVVTDATSTPKTAAVAFSVPCNGRYLVTASATTTNNELLPRDSASRSVEVEVSMPAPTVTGLEATADGRRVEVRWDDMRTAAPDVAGYVVERSIDGAAFDRFASVGAEETAITDTDLPPSAGSAAYRVMSMRPSPGGTQVSAASVPAATTYPAAPIDPATGQPVPDEPTPAGGDTGTDTGTGGSGDGDTGAGRTGRSAGAGSGVTLPRVGISGTFFPPLLRPSTVELGATTTTIDGGFAEDLPYDDPSVDGASGGGGDLALLEEEGEEGTSGRGMVIPVATALVLAVWALHLRMLARAARPAS